MNNKTINKDAFTLIELIVIITILAILTTIAYISFGDFTISARDANRIADVKNMEVSLDNFYNEVGSYPIPSNNTGITYSGGVLFYCGTFGESVFRNTQEISKIPKDPLFNTEYSYSISSQKNVYEIGYIQEGNNLTYNPIINKAKAKGTYREVVSKINGTYNGLMVATHTGGFTYIFSAPSITLTDLSNTNILSLTDKFVYDGRENISSIYKNLGIITTGIFSFEPQLIYSGVSLPSSPEKLKGLIINLQNSLHNINHPTPLFSNINYKNIIELDPDNTNELYYFGTNYINKDLGGRFILKYGKSCKDILGTEDDKGDGLYTISPNGLTKMVVYCDMTTDGGGWTRIRKRERGVGYTDGSDINKTMLLGGTELMAQYTRHGQMTTSTGLVIDVSGKKYGLYYKWFKTKQGDLFNNTNIDCGEHTTISDLISHIKGGTWGDCGRNCPRVGATSGGACITSLEYTDIQVDDLGVNVGLVEDKVIDGFSKDPCIINQGHHTQNRNVSWNSNGSITHRIDSSTTLTSLGGGDICRCGGTCYNSNVQGYQTNEVYIR